MVGKYLAVLPTCLDSRNAVFGSLPHVHFTSVFGVCADLIGEGQGEVMVRVRARVGVSLRGGVR